MEVFHADLVGWESFRQLLARSTATPLGRDRALALTPTSTPTLVRARLRETAEARQALITDGEPPWTGVADVRPLLAHAAPEGAVLEGRALVTLGQALAAAERLAAYGARITAAAPTLAARWGALPRCPGLAGSLPRALHPDGRLVDAASPQLRVIRR